MVKMIDHVNHKIEKNKRRSFLKYYYYYIISKLMVSMDHPELLPQGPLLRTRLRLLQHDSIWKKRCDEPGWI